MTHRRFTYSYNDTSAHYDIWFTSDDDTLDTIVFLGVAQIDRLPKWVAESCPPRTAVVQGAPYWHAASDGSDLTAYMLGYTTDVVKNIQASYAFKAVDVVAESQAAPAVIKYFADRQRHLLLNKLVLLQPLGLNPQAFSGTGAQRITTLKSRITKNARHQLVSLILDSRLRYNHRLLHTVANLRNPKVKAQYDSGLKHSALTDLQQLTEAGASITIICGAHDKIFPPDEIAASLKEVAIDVPIISVPGVPHSPLATRQGLKLLAAAFSVSQ